MAQNNILTRSLVHNDRRTKYNTMTPGEAKKFKLNMRPPLRTASVLHKPRAPPIVVTNLDDCSVRVDPQRTTILSTAQNDEAMNGLPSPTSMGTPSYGLRSSSSCSNQGSNLYKRHSLNYGQNRSSTLDRLSLRNNKYQLPSSQHDSQSNLSYRSTLDVVDSAYGSGRLFTMSVDLGHSSDQLRNSRIHNQNNDFNNQKNLSNESYSSAKSHFSDSIKLKSESKGSLSSSTSKVFQTQFSNLKRFFLSRRALVNGIDKKSETNQNDILSESISQICLNRSQSPPVCPPPPNELKSIPYLNQNSVNYSNYDDFTRARNRQTISILNGTPRNEQQVPVTSQLEYGQPPTICDFDESEPWQLTSLPVSYERNLTTVFEERQNQNEASKYHDANFNQSNCTIVNGGRSFIEPPNKFDDKCYEATIQNNDFDSSTNSSQSITSSANTDPLVEYHRQTATAFRFSYAQHNHPFEQPQMNNNVGLPPRMPNMDAKQSSTGSTNNSSIGSTDNQMTSESSRSPDLQDYDHINTDEATANITMQSDTSTLHGDHSIYVNKCSELERGIESLMDKLVTKEKELTGLHLKQLSSEYLIDQLKSTISKLEKENAQLKAVVKANRLNL